MNVLLDSWSQVCHQGRCDHRSRVLLGSVPGAQRVRSTQSGSADREGMKGTDEETCTGKRVPTAGVEGACLISTWAHTVQMCRGALPPLPRTYITADPVNSFK